MAQQNQVFLFRGALSSHPPIHDRIARLYRLLQQPSAAPTPDQIDAKRGAAAKVVAEVARTNPDAAAVVIESLLRARLGEQLMHALGAELPASESDPAEPSEQDPAYASPSEQAEYQKLYEYNLGLTGDKSRPPAGHVLGSGSPLEAVIGGQPETIDPSQLRAALAIGMASMHKKSAASPASVPGEHPPSKELYLFWLVIALSAGAIVAALAVS